MKDHLNGWESDVYGQGKQLNKYTFGDVYYYTNRYFLSQTHVTKETGVIEFGSGAGNNLVYFAGLGMSVVGMEVSSTACSEARNKLKEFKNIRSEIICDNFCKKPLPFEDNFFDLVLDRGAFTHNVSSDIKTVVSESFRILKPGGLLFSFDFFSDNDSRFGRGLKVEENVYKDIGGHTFQGVPLVHFSNLDEILNLYKQFKLEFVEEHMVKRYYPYENEKGAYFDIIARKP